MIAGRRWALVALAAILSCGCTAEKTETSAPSTQEWTYGLEKVWEYENPGGEALLRPAEPRIADDGTLYFHDFERHLSYIIGGDGTLTGTFAPRGENDGEVPFYLNCFPAGDHVVICAPDKLHFFTQQGDFVKAVPNNLFVRFPLAFNGGTEFWVGPGALGDSPGGIAVVTHIDLASGSETIVHEFALSDAEKRPSGGAVVVGLTPQLKMGLDTESSRIYYGKNSDTLIYWRTLDGSDSGSFALTGISRPVTEVQKRDHFTKRGVPAERVDALVQMLPDRMTYYNRIQVIDGLVYLLSAESFGGPEDAQAVDVYSPDGRHLYHGRIQAEEGWHIANPDNLQLGPGVVFAVQENDAGERKIVKYSVTLPKS